jgi:HSP20 family protein
MPVQKQLRGDVMLEIDEAIGQVENLYRAVTGRQFAESEAPSAPIPDGADPGAHVRLQWNRLLAALHAAPPMRRAWMPPISVADTTSDLTVYVDVPGVNRDRLNVRLESGFLVIEGQRAIRPPDGEHPESERPSRFFAEPPSGPFRRSVALPGGLDLAQMSAHLVDGVLEVRIPRIAEGAPKPVPVS